MAIKNELDRLNKGLQYPDVGYIYVHRETSYHTGKVVSRILRITNKGGGCAQIVARPGLRCRGILATLRTIPRLESGRWALMVNGKILPQRYNAVQCLYAEAEAFAESGRGCVNGENTVYMLDSQVSSNPIVLTTPGGKRPYTVDSFMKECIL